MKNKSSLWALLAVMAVIAIAVGSRLWVWNSGEHAGPAAIGGPFALIDQDGKAATDKTYAGRWMLVYFGYTYCPDVCPTALGVVAAALDQLDPAERAKIAPIFISVDPERDTPQVMKDYAAAFAPDMIGLTGNIEQVEAAKKAYRVYAAKAKSDDPNSYTVDHSSILYLMGPDGAFVKHFAHGTSSADVAAGLKKALSGK